MLYLRFGHFLGLAAWIGGALAIMVIANVMWQSDAARREALAAVLAQMNGYVVAPGAVVTTATGVLLTMTMTSRGMGEVLARPGMVIMQVAGVAAAVLAIFAGVPTANQVATVMRRLGDGDLPPGVSRLRRRLAIVSSLATGLALFALFFGVVIR
jgi:uncharacterized membrane protein